VSDLNLERLDLDGAIRENAEAMGLDRGAFFKKAAVAGGGVVAGGALFGPFLGNAAAAISTKKSKRNDVKILNYALTLEYLEEAFYEQAVANRAFGSPEYEVFAKAVRAHEAAHVKFLRKALGSAAVKKPTFDFGDAVVVPATFATTAQVLEDTGVAAYAAQGPNLSQRPVVKAALSIHSVEARHAAWIRFLNDGGAPGAASSKQPAPASFDKALSERAVLKAVGDTGFIKS
jgi:lysozyme family protein